MKFVKIFTVISPLIVSFVFISSCSLFDSDGSKNTYSSSLTTTNPGLCADNEWSSDGTVSTNCQDCSKITNSTGQSSSDRKSCVCNTGYDWISTITKCSTDVLLGFTDKKILKISSAGGGADFTAVIESTSGFSTIPDYAYYLGNDGFDSDIAALLYAGGNTIICFSDGNILKMKGTGDTGTNLSFITKSGDTFSDVSGHNNIVGYDKFDKPVRSILYAGGNTILSFTDDNLLKIKGTGGTGADFTAINKSGDAISNMTGYSYLAGYDKFDSVITAMSYAEGNTILSFLDHNVLKMKGTGGTGAHFTAVNKSGDSFSNVTGYSYLLGYDKFNWSVTSVIYAEGNTLMSFADGNVLKMKGTGGTGADFTAISQSGDVFSNITGYSYLLGYDKFDSVIMSMLYVEGNTLMSFADGNVLKMKGTGGTGADFTAINKTGSVFSNVSGYDYLVGYDSFNYAISSMIKGGN